MADPQRDRDSPSEWSKLAGVGTEFFAALLVPGAIGFWLDKVLHTRPWIMLGCGLLGFATGLYLLLRAAKQQFHD